MTNDIAIEFKNVFERYDVEILLDGKSTRESFEALHDISFSIQKSESVAIIGPNGAGKSTILRLIAGLLRPEKGEVRVHGRVGSLLDLGAGFHPELTGRDNLLLNASLYNFSREELDAKYDQILAFADIGKFINAPVRCYSQGMYVRLAFSLAIHVDPDILLIDDCLSVGDDNFRTKSLDKALEFKTKNKTIVFVTHDFSLARQMCGRGIYVKESRIIADTSVDAAVARYIKPLEVDRERYKYLSAKISEEENSVKLEEERLRLEEEKQVKIEEERQRIEEERRVKAEEKRLKLEEEKRVKVEEERQRSEAEKRKLEKERRKEGYVLHCGTSLKLHISPSKVRIFHRDHELTSHNGIRTHFVLRGDDISSDSAIWRVKKISDAEIVCFLRWTKPKALFQVWYFKTLDDGTVDLKIMMRTRETLPVENEIVEYCLQTPCGIFEEDRLRNKATVFFCRQDPDFKMGTLRKDQVCGIQVAGRDCFRPYFLTVPEQFSCKEAKQRYSYFEGRLSSGGKTAVAEGSGLASYQLGSGRTKIEFYDGSCQLVWGGKRLTTGLGIYTSLHSKGIWYDSTQARWQIKASSQEKLVVEGSWPWIPIAQVWEILPKDESTVLLNVRMKVFQEMPITMQETVMMMSAEYGKWSAGKEIKEFPEGFTSDDFFRFCLWANKADGVSGLSSHSDH